jgi:hypothetical protein
MDSCLTTSIYVCHHVVALAGVGPGNALNGWKSTLYTTLAIPKPIQARSDVHNRRNNENSMTINILGITIRMHCRSEIPKKRVRGRIQYKGDVLIGACTAGTE